MKKQERGEPETTRVESRLESGIYTVLLKNPGLLEERVIETIERMVGLTPEQARNMVSNAPVTIVRNISQSAAYRIQRELQMFGAVVEVTNSEIEQKLPEAQETIEPVEIVKPKEPVETAPDENSPIDRKVGEYQVFITNLGLHPDSSLPFLKEWLRDFETLAAVKYKIEQNITRVQPTFFGLAQDTAADVVERLRAWDLEVSLYHEDDANRPAYDHDRYGVALIEVGENPEAVGSLLVERLAISHDEAQNILAELPQVIFENISVDEAIAISDQFVNAGARCDLPFTRPIVWLDTSLEDIPRNPGGFVFILQKAGVQKRLLSEMVGALRPDLTTGEIQLLLEETPVALVEGLALDTLEMLKIRFGDFGATTVIQPLEVFVSLGRPLHPQNPFFQSGNYFVVLEGYKQTRKIALIQEIRSLIPGIFLPDLMQKLEEIPTIVVENVDRKTAQDVAERVTSAGGSVSIVAR